MIKIKGIKQLEKSELIETKGAYCADYIGNLNFVCNYFSFLSAERARDTSIIVEAQSLQSA